MLQTIQKAEQGDDWDIVNHYAAAPSASRAALRAFFAALAAAALAFFASARAICTTH